jgi:rare lipoprotein A (peptidoglycan hydrolase)
MSRGAAQALDFIREGRVPVRLVVILRSSIADSKIRARVAFNEQPRISAVPLEKTDGMIRHARLDNESCEYLERREELRRTEVELIRQSEKVAAFRRSLPQGTPVQDYCFLL